MLLIDRTLKAKLVSMAKSENGFLSSYIEKILKEDVAKHDSKHARTKIE